VSWDLTEIGVLFADQAEAEAGTDNTKVMTPLRTAQAIAADITDEPTARAGTNNEQLMTPLRTAQHFETAFDATEQQIGVGQTWQDLTASRARNTIYQNTTGKPIGVAITGRPNSSLAILEVSLDGSSFLGELITLSANGTTGASTIIPNGVYYRLSASAGISALTWAELR
jgi:hypothetical protein